MDWTALLSSERLGDAGYSARANRSIFVQDHDRIVFSAPFRRLANKTQVQPLYEHDHVHHRLIHSVEVASVGRSLAMRIGQWLVDHGHVPPGEESTVANIVQAACVAHDIGNPPFGHSGEEAMGAWFAEALDLGHGLMADLPKALHAQFTRFEGNAQGFRILTRLEMYRNAGGMRLSKATLGAFTKYPVTAAARDGSGVDYVGLKKFGIFQSEQALLRDAATTLGLPVLGQGAGQWWRRHPLVFAVEAADDICYNIVDLEDAFTTDELPFATVRDLLFEVAGNPNRDMAGLTRAEQIALLRALAIGQAVDSCFQAFVAHYDAIMSGEFSQSLVQAGPLGPAFARIGQLARDQIFTGRRKTELELSGRRVIANVMSGILPVYQDLARRNWDAQAIGDHARQLVRALDLDLRDVIDAETALHALADHTSGMTDRHALRVSRMLSGT